MGFTVLVLCRAPFYICLDKVRVCFLVCLMELYCVFTIAVGTAGNFGFPISLKKYHWKFLDFCPWGGKRVSFPTPLFSDSCKAAWFFFGLPWPAAPKTNAHGPPTSSAGGEKWFIVGREKWEPETVTLSFPKGDPLPCPQPAQPVGRGRMGFQGEGPQARYPVRSTAFPHTTPPEKGVQREEPLPSGVLSPISSQEMGPRLGKPRFPARSNGKGKDTYRSRFPVQKKEQ